MNLKLKNDFVEFYIYKINKFKKKQNFKFDN